MRNFREFRISNFEIIWKSSILECFEIFHIPAKKGTATKSNENQRTHLSLSVLGYLRSVNKLRLAVEQWTNMLRKLVETVAIVKMMTRKTKGRDM